MFPFSNSDNNNLEPLFKRPSFQLYDQIQNPISKHDDDSPFFSNFPSPFFDEHELPLNQIFHTDDQKMPDPTKKESPKLTSSKLKQKTDDQPATPLRRRNLVAAPRKRTGKKDRHSKICTAQGIRDRRMRLSLQVARKFFDLQDMLGYDKASKTIEWLFNKSKKAIKELANMSDAKSESFVSECEVVSGIEESSNIEIKEGLVLPEHGQKGEQKLRKIACKPNTRESREKARARARCRTEEKMMGKRIEDPMQLRKSSPSSPNLEKLGQSSSSPFDRDDQPYGAGAGDYCPLVQQPSDVGTIEKLLGSSSSNCPISCSIDPSFMGIFGNWDGLLSNDRLNYAVTNIQASMAGNPNSIYSSSATTSDFPFFHQ